jgi:hypothetical protein
VKVYIHILIIAILATLTIVLYDKGLGAIPFLLSGVYLGFICVKELQHFKKSKRL